MTLKTFRPVVLKSTTALGLQAALKLYMCGPQQSFNKTSNILCNRLRFAQ